MRFRTWFKRWFNSLARLLTIGSRRKLSERQKIKYRENRRKAKRQTFRLLNQKRTRRRSRGANYGKTLKLLTDFMVKTLGIFFISPSSGKASAKKQQNRAVAKKSAQSLPRQVRAPVAAPIKREAEPKPKPATSIATTPRENTKKYEPTKKKVEIKGNDDAPKSKPINEKDQYIKKRLIIRGSYYCDSEVISRLRVGTYFDLRREKDNKYDPDAVVLLLDGEKIGYVAKEDLAPYTIALDLGRDIYGVITDITNDASGTKYEYETWFRN